MNYWHLQMSLPEGRGGKHIDPKGLLKEAQPIVGTGEWDDIQCENFKKKVQIKDILCIKDGQTPVALCRVISDYFKDTVLQAKFDHENYRKVKVLEYYSGTEKFPQPMGTLQIASNSDTPTWKFIDNWYQNYKIKNSMQKYSNLLKSNKNLILTGAPGTGKTYLAKQIALQMLFKKNKETELSDDEKLLFKEHYEFVQFHPSYDYTDFVEGLRPVKKENSELGFELRDGIFKAFCKKALQTTATPDNFDELYSQFTDGIAENGLSLATPTKKREFDVEINSTKSCVAIPRTETATRMIITKEMLKEYLVNDKIMDWKPYIVPLGNYFKEHYKLQIHKKQEVKLPYIFIIDEINRAEISKVFGELFFSIDPGYRGEDGKVKTQYANLAEDGDVFKDGFYVPENVYIIGTMNDIDRSVESFDFAMRRRFAWVEITAESQKKMLHDVIPTWATDAEKRMTAINSVIGNIEGLNSSYHIGPAYFLKLADYSGDFQKLWDNHIGVVLKEYLRGRPDAKVEFDKLGKAYNLA